MNRTEQQKFWYSVSGLLLSQLLILIVFSQAAFAQVVWEKEWNETVAAAKKEGKLSVILGGAASRGLRPVYNKFQEKFGIEVVMSTGSGRLHGQRILAERRSKQYTIDLIQVGGTTMSQTIIPNKVLAPISPQFILPEVKDQSLYFQKRHWYGDPEQKYVFLVAARHGVPSIYINTNLVKSDDVNSYEDLLKPQYRGLHVSGLMTTAAEGATSVAEVYTLPNVGKAWLQRYILEMKPTRVADIGIGLNWLIEGKKGILMFAGTEGRQVEDLQKRGAPVAALDKTMKEGTTLASNGAADVLMLADGAPHPNAAKLFINWFLSREGQLLMQKTEPRQDSTRIDIPKDMVDPVDRRKEKYPYVFLVADPNFVKIQEDSIKFVESLLKKQ
jgi:ABC-type Fe3+ transport system substrate-binding protein